MHYENLSFIFNQFNQFLYLKTRQVLSVSFSPVVNKTLNNYFEKSVAFLANLFVNQGTMQSKRSKKRAGSSRYIVVYEAACLRIYFVFKSRLDFIKNMQPHRFL